MVVIRSDHSGSTLCAILYGVDIVMFLNEDYQANQGVTSRIEEENIVV